jgi:hypothetical protein
MSMGRQMIQHPTQCCGNAINAGKKRFRDQGDAHAWFSNTPNHGVASVGEAEDTN